MNELNKPEAGKIYTVEIRQAGSEWQHTCPDSWTNGYTPEFQEAEAYSMALLVKYFDREIRVIAEYIGIGRQLVSYRVNL